MTTAHLLRVHSWLRSPLQDNIHTPSDTAGGFAEFFDDDLDSTILAHESERGVQPSINNC